MMKICYNTGIFSMNGGFIMENVRLKLLDSKNIFGTMNSGSICLSNITSVDKEMIMWKYDLSISELENHQFDKNDKSQIFANHRRNFAEANGFDYNKMFMMDQNLKLSGKRGSYFEITEDYVEANPKGWTDIAEDILITKVPDVAIGYPVADCPVIIMEDIAKGVTAVAHCSGELIDSRLPMMMADSLNDAYQTKDEDIRVAVGPMAGPNWTYTDNPPKWAHDYDFWLKTGAIIENDDKFKINLQKAITNQLAERNIDSSHIIYSSVDTILDREYYSNSESSKGNQKKYGRQFVGAIYQKTR